ncbi:MAG: DUF3791 domain-containing protein [Eubacterium sp.]|nr:DUF3791 domain-containing protein [Eubacterium sp.]
MLTEKRLNNTIYLIFHIAECFSSRHHMTKKEFLEFDKKYDILGYISECPDVFDSLTDDEIIEELERYVSQY